MKWKINEYDPRTLPAFWRSSWDGHILCEEHDDCKANGALAKACADAYYNEKIIELARERKAKTK